MKHVTLILFCLLFCLQLTSKSAFAESYDEGMQAYKERSDVSSPVHVTDNIYNLFAATRCIIGGDKCDTTPAPPGTGLNFKNSMMGRVHQGIVLAYKPPVSSTDYIAYLQQQAGIIRPAYAQGIGFSGLSPLINIWKAFRNVAYGFLIIVMTVIGFLVLLRHKIDPRTVVSIQNALPRVIVSLILITFSYAIVGLMIDLMYLLIFLAFFALGQANPEIIQNYSGGALTNLWGAAYSTGQGSVNSIIHFIGVTGANPQLITAMIVGVVGTFIGAGLGGALTIFGGPIIGAVVGAGAGGAAGYVTPNAVVGALVWLVMLFIYLRILFMLLAAWVQVILSLIFGPLQIMVGAIPGVNTFGSWMKSLIASLSTFPITIIVFFMSTLISGSGNIGKLWTPPGLGGSADGNTIAGLISLGLVMSIPSLVNGFKQVLKAPAVPGGVGAITAPFGSVYQVAMQGAQMQYYLGGPLKSLGRFLPGGKRT